MPTTFLDCLKALAEETGDLTEDATTATGTTTTIVCATFDNSNLSASEDEDTAVLIESGNNAGLQRSVRRGGLDNATGTLTFAEEWPAAVASGVTFSGYGRMPALSVLGGPSYEKAIGRALRRLWIEDQISFTGVDQQQHYPVDTVVYPWLTKRELIIAVNHARTAADDRLVPLRPDQWDWEWRGSTYNLVLRTAPWNTGDTGVVSVYRPANSLLKLSAQARATVAAGAVTAIAVAAGGYYASTPTVTITGGGGSGATATATLANNTVASIAVTNGGTLYTTDPTVTLTAGTWANQTSQRAGLVTLADETLSDLDDVVAMGKAYVYDQLAKLHAPGQTVEAWQDMADRAYRVAARRPAAQRGSNRRTGVVNLRPVAVAGPGRRGGWN